MKLLILILSLTLSLSSLAQTFKLQDNTNRAQLDVCQENHNRILKKFANQADSQIARLLMGLTIENNAYTPKFKMESYKMLLSELIIRRIIISELTKQLNAQALSDFYKIKGNSDKPFLNPESINIDLESQHALTMDQVIAIKNLRIAKDYVKGLKTSLAKNAVTILASKKFRKIGAAIFARIIAKQTGKIVTPTILKSVMVSFGSKLFVSGATGLVISLVTFPLHAYRLTPENEWTDLLAKYPELIMVPEWMKNGGITDAPWMAHCNAIQRRTSYVEKALKKSIDLDESDFLSSVATISMMEEPKVEQTKPGYYYQPQVAPADNTYVKKPVMLEQNFAPRWAYKLN